MTDNELSLIKIVRTVNVLCGYIAFKMFHRTLIIQALNVYISRGIVKVNYILKKIMLNLSEKFL